MVATRDTRKIALQADLWYNETLKMFIAAMLQTSRDTRQTFMGGSSMATLPPHDHKRKIATSGIYAITNTSNGKQYIGRSVDIEHRWYRHRLHLSKNQHHSPALQHAWNLYGENLFAFTILEVVSDPALLPAREQHFFDLLQPAYNILPNASDWTGMAHSEEAKEKQRLAHLGRKMPEGHGKKMALINTGRKRSPESLKKYRQARLGKPLSAETKAKLSTAKVGKTHSEESRKKMSVSQTGRKHKPETIEKIKSYHVGAKRSDEAREHMSIAQKNKKPVSDETRKRLSEAGTGRKHSEETLRKMREAQRERRAKEKND